MCSATFEQLLAFGATFCGFSNLEQVLPFRAIFEQNIGLEHISSTKKSTISWKTSIHANFLPACRRATKEIGDVCTQASEFLEGLSCYQPFEHITCHLTTFRRPNWPIVSLLFMNGNGWREAAFIVYFSHDIDTWFVLSRYSVLQLESE